MSGPHRFVSAARHAVCRALSQLPTGTAVVLAVSGGADSMALAASVIHEAQNKKNALGNPVYSITIDHGIREESSCEAQAVVENLKAMGIDAHSQKIDIGTGSGPEGDAREARYRAIAAFAREIGADAPAPVLLGHNADDQAETVLLGLSRGAGARSMSGMPESGFLPTTTDVPFIRPVIQMKANALRTVCSELGIDFVDDPSNALDGPWTAADGSPLRRSALRHNVIPALEQAFGRDVVGALVRTGRMLRDDDDALTSIAVSVFERLVKQDNSHNRETNTGLVLPCEHLKNEHRAVRTRVLRIAYSACGGSGADLVYWHLDALDKLIVGRDNNSGIDLPGMKAWRSNNQLVFIPDVASQTED
ncbi:tRNA lysidine(34) synthetase TilS [Arcanobacterium ihumii]|uniref:tRNA lysidine(34) synthetase TilS n=1 Tax=Arcanobacterium ihumii TaxID=2138162 RepID=UPI000F53F6B7|nr:tRNA lysidine(34) synthetase TilS [Arcanobacterium ihumii]